MGVELQAIAGDDDGGASVSLALGFASEDDITDEAVANLRDLVRHTYTETFEHEPQAVIVRIN